MNDSNETMMKKVSTDTMPRTTKTPEEIINLFNKKKVDDDWSFVGYKPSDTGKWTHDYHRYPAKFIPQNREENGSALKWEDILKVLFCPE